MLPARPGRLGDDAPVMRRAATSEIGPTRAPRSVVRVYPRVYNHVQRIPENRAYIGIEPPLSKAADPNIPGSAPIG